MYLLIYYDLMYVHVCSLFKLITTMSNDFEMLHGI